MSHNPQCRAILHYFNKIKPWIFVVENVHSIPNLLSLSHPLSLQGKYNHGNDIKELANVTSIADDTTTVSIPIVSSTVCNFVGAQQHKNSGLVGSCSSISGSIITDAVNSNSIISSSGQSSTTNILNSSSSSCDKLSPWSRMQRWCCTWRCATDLFVVLACKSCQQIRRFKPI